MIYSINDTILWYDNVSNRLSLENKKKNLPSSITGSFSKYLLRNLRNPGTLGISGAQRQSKQKWHCSTRILVLGECWSVDTMTEISLMREQTGGCRYPGPGWWPWHGVLPSQCRAERLYLCIPRAGPTVSPLGRVWQPIFNEWMSSSAAVANLLEVIMWKCPGIEGEKLIL